MRIKEYFKPSSLEQAYNVLKDKNATIIGGGAFLRISSKRIKSALDLSKLELDFIEDKEDRIEIGAMTTLREVEENKALKDNFSGVISKATGSIMGVQFRNVATIGGSVAGRYGFSDVITPLLALNTFVELYKGGKITLKDFLETKGKIKDILIKIIIMKDKRKASFQSVRNTAIDFAILNASASNIDNDFKISVGARPGIAKMPKEAMEFLRSCKVDKEAAIKASEIASEELNFGSDIRGSWEYRKELCKALVKRAILEVM
ncbi:FAD-binding protein [Clostridium botulinum C]|uniref:FAD-binding protein n=4 Tax=Clostridium TaxID=1485 RepID=C4IXL3_CLOBO|nr:MULTISPECIES: FAD binding domain-containing protein [Clostridium]EGO89291.1 FAD-binding protein [Clostridium botulinum C str. Stockholm]ACT33667.1 molybdopterin dehydrogenase, FAD-binding protein [Clostridium botulinum D str. 1873]AYF55340.1 FAD-binding protein [Clostridium novyi]MBO3441485.1 FAD binding domain-containing protein [Clostridium haemolyticum]MCD3195275.1 FAD-binding protein [Clostridium botulinum C]